MKLGIGRDMTELGGPTLAPKPSRYCPGCGRPLEETDQFCPLCGRPLSPQASIAYSQRYAYQPPSTVESIMKFGRLVTLIALAALMGLLVVNVVILAWSPTIILPEAADGAYGNTLFLIVPWADPLIGLVELSGWSFGIYHVLLVFAICASFAWMVVTSVDPLKKELSLERPKGGHSPLWIIGTIFFAILAMNFIYALILTLLNVEITTPDFASEDLWQLLHGLASASVWEELITRVLIIGVPLLLIDLAYHKRKKLSRYFFGGGFEFGGKELALIWASAGIFALGHIVYWDTWKIIPTWIAGLAFGYLFLRLGLYACIMLHFMVDYLSVPMDIAPDSTAVVLILGLLILFWDLLGSVYFAIFFKRIIDFLTGKVAKPQKSSSIGPMPSPSPMAPPPAPPQQGSTWSSQARPAAKSVNAGFYSCTNCGGTEARFVDGKLECIRCGHRE
ncbi:MAG: CPBP family glutamic-type intramembrane protease [Methanomassiliicoccales archaeon]|nr:CPBP family glutamic-type intramembrane protease [Methanomassiliicoccales archaeon]